MVKDRTISVPIWSKNMISLFRKLGTKTKDGANQSAITTTSLIGATVAATLIASPAFAGGSGMPWEGPLQQVVDSFTGPVAQAGGVIAVTIFGLGVAFSESGSGLRRGVSILFGVAIAFAAASFFMGFFGFGGGAVIG
jgi:type IV secretion system protein TrbC